MQDKEKVEIEELLRKENCTDLICVRLYLNSFHETKKILEIPEWKNEKFKGLLTSNIWSSNYEDIKKILEMPEWEDEKFKGLLTSNIWNSNYESVKKKLKLDYWQDSKYKHLLTPSIFNISIKNIDEGIRILEKYNVSQYISSNCLRRNQKDLELLIQYMLVNNIELIVEDEKKEGQKKLNPILNASTTALKTKYRIDIKRIKAVHEDKDEKEGIGIDD